VTAPQCHQFGFDLASQDFLFEDLTCFAPHRHLKTVQHKPFSGPFNRPQADSGGLDNVLIGQVLVALFISGE
jgi:hypothetical protein